MKHKIPGKREGDKKNLRFLDNGGFRFVVLSHQWNIIAWCWLLLTSTKKHAIIFKERRKKRRLQMIFLRKSSFVSKMFQWIDLKSTWSFGEFHDLFKQTIKNLSGRHSQAISSICLLRFVYDALSDHLTVALERLTRIFLNLLEICRKGGK